MADTAVRTKRVAAGWGLNPKAQFLTQLLLNDHEGLGITSGRRSEEDNRRLRAEGIDASLKGHTSGDEVDLVGPRSVMRAAAAQAARTRGVRIVMHDAGNGLHLHIRWPR